MDSAAEQTRERSRAGSDLVRLADRVDRLARRCRAQSLKPVAIAARVAVERARSLAADEANEVEALHRAAVDASRRAAQAAAAEAEAERILKLRLDQAAAAVDSAVVALKQRCAELEAIVDGPENAVAQQHALDFSPAALRIFRFAADTAPRVLEIAHVSAFLRECAVEFGSADAALPGALRNDYASGRYFRLRAAVKRNATRCLWLAEKLLACRSGAPVPAAALAPDVTRHDVNWGAESARCDGCLAVSSEGSTLALSHSPCGTWKWAQGAVGVTRGKHWFSVTVTRSSCGWVKVGWVDRALRTPNSPASGATFEPWGRFWFGTAPLSSHQKKDVPRVKCPCTVGCLLDLKAGAITVFVNGEPLAEQCEYTFPTDREWAPSVSLWREDEVHSNAV